MVRYEYTSRNSSFIILHYNSGAISRTTLSAALRYQGALHPVLQEYLYAVALVLKEDFAHLKRCFCVIDEGIHLKVMFKTAEIHIRRAYRGQLIIRNHQFGVQEAFLIEIDLDSRIEHICQIRAGTDASSGYQHAWATSDAHRHLTRRLSA